MGDGGGTCGCCNRAWRTRRTRRRASVSRCGMPGRGCCGSGARSVTRGEADELPETMTVRLVSRSGETTAIGTLDTRTGEFSFGDWYTLDGRRLSGRPAQKGLYIRNGRKEVIR